MRARTWYGWLIVTVAAVAAAGGSTLAAPTVKGDTAAWGEITAAFKKLYVLPGFRVKVSVSDGTAAIAEFASPSIHWIVQSSQGSVETFVVGSESAVRFAGQCRRTQTTGMNIPYKDPTSLTGDVTVTRKPDTNIDGTPVHAYAYITLSPGGPRNSGDAFVGAQTGLPRRVVNVEPDGKTTTLDYYDYGVKIAITLPC